MARLKTLVEYIESAERHIALGGYIESGEVLESIIHYKNLMNSKPELSMFVPCNIEGEPLSKELGDELCNYCTIPEESRHPSPNHPGCEGVRCKESYDTYKEEEWDPAEKDVLFEGFTYDGRLWRGTSIIDIDHINTLNELLEYYAVVLDLKESKNIYRFLKDEED